MPKINLCGDPVLWYNEPLRRLVPAVLIVWLNMLNATAMEKTLVVSAAVRDAQTIDVHLTISPEEPLPALTAEDVRISPALPILSLLSLDHRLEIKTSPLDITESYQLELLNEKIELDLGALLDQYHSTKQLGCTWDDTKTVFRLFAPRAKSVRLFLYENINDDYGTSHPLTRDADGVWELTLDGHFFGRYYAYSIDGSHGESEMYDPDKLVADPYSRAVATENDYLHRGKTLIMDTSNFNWEGDAPLGYKNEDLIIYECHVRDLTAHPSVGGDPALAGTYKGLIQKGNRGGFEHIKSMGVNAVEFLPIQDFGVIELPFGKDVGDVINTWNPYARNHWGYMTSYFFAPEAYYATEQSLEPGKISGADGRQVNEFKDVVKAFHKEGIAVILDVVYNHVSQYDQNAFKYIDKKYYFRLNPDATFCSASGCGNDFKTERPMARWLIVDSVKYWLQEYHIDGFRFDLAAMIDWETCDEILREAKKINPNVIIIAEPWGGGFYTPAEFSQHGWAAWNDQIRNGVKGQHPQHNHGFIFGKWFDQNSLKTMKNYVLGNPAEADGLFQEKAHAINYLESHDDHTFGDFVRIGLGGPEVVEDVDKNAELTEEQLRLNKLGALFLFTSQGAVMIHEGQEWARSKVIAPTPVPEENVGHIDHNSYNKDNETNWLNFAHADKNAELVGYYKGLIRLRKNHPAFRRAAKSAIEFFEDENNLFAFAFKIDKNGSGDTYDFFVALNGDRTQEAVFTLPPGKWDIVVDGHTAGLLVIGNVSSNTIKIPPSTGMVLRH